MRGRALALIGLLAHTEARCLSQSRVGRLPSARAAVIRASVAHPEGLTTPARIPAMHELEGYWQLKCSQQLTSFGGNPVFELRGDGTFKFPSRYGKPKSWGISESAGSYWIEINLVDNLSTPVTLRGRLMLSEYFPMVVEGGEVLKPARSNPDAAVRVSVGGFELSRIQ